MSDAAGVGATRRWRNRFEGAEGRGGFRLDLALLDFGCAVWLAYAFAVFRGNEGTVSVEFAAVCGATATAVLALGELRARLRIPLASLVAGLLGVVVLTLLAKTIAHVQLGAITWAAAAWLGTGMLAVATLARAGHRKSQRAGGPSGISESLRWLTFAAAAVWLVQPFYTHRPIGAGDAYWYTLMLADFVEQIRAGQFPVWVGATEYAFNGAVSPLRLAPWFQHVGAVLDALTCRSLSPVALKNALLCSNLIVAAGSAYFFLRAILPRRPTIALLLSLATIASPAVLAPLYVGDQYMTFLALPFLPAVAYGIWRVAERADLAGWLVLGGGAGALWLAHPPIALWTAFFSTLACGCIVLARRFRIAWRHVGLAAIVGAFVGGYAILSALSLDNTNHQTFTGEAAGAEIARAFPANLRWLSATLDQQSDYQPGALLLAVFGAMWVGTLLRRNVAALALAIAASAMFYLLVPAPGVAAWWEHMPSVVMQATNNWPMQRFFPIWAVFSTFAFAAAQTRVEITGRAGAATIIALALGLGWSAQEAARFAAKARLTVNRSAQSDLMLAAHNVLLTRYCFVSFSSTPGYFSHGYMDPVLEHRLLRRDLTPLASNAESAVRKGALPGPVGDGPLAHGTWRAVNDNRSTHYNLTPRLALPADVHLALWVEPRPPPFEGWLQIVGDDLFREYLLPDSGTGTVRKTAPRSYGLLPSSSRVIPLFSRRPEDAPRTDLIVPSRPAGENFDFADFELWRYSPADLPIFVRSFVPYQLRVRTPEAGYVELPRVWLRGYRAKIHGKHVFGERSPDDLVMFPVPAGESEFVVKWVPPLWLEIAYGSSVVAWCAIAVLGVWALCRPPRTN